MTEAQRYPILIEEAPDGGFGAWAPDLPGCVALGETVEEAEVGMREAIAFHIDGLREHGEPVPEPSFAEGGAYVRVPA
jgi:predicted RNase H-like HicB family nuclease